MPSDSLRRPRSVTAPEPKMSRSAFMVWLIGEAFRYTVQSSDEFFRAHGITHAQLRILYRLNEEPGLSGADVARRTFSSPQAAYVALTALENKGLVDRALGPGHQRIVRCKVTAKGRRVLDACLKDIRVVSARFGEVLDAEETEQMIALLQRCLDVAGREASL